MFLSLTPTPDKVHVYLIHTIKDQVRILQKCWWFSLGTVISSTNKNIEDITEILLKVALNSPNWKK